MANGARPSTIAALPAPAEPMLPRRRFVVSDLFALQDSGRLGESDVELIDGDLVIAAAKRNDHEVVKRALLRLLARLLPEDVAIGVEQTLYLADDQAPEPDIALYPLAILPEDLRGDQVYLLIEIAQSSLARDLGRKAQIYAAAGIGNYWVIEAQSRRLFRHRGPLSDGAWREIQIVDSPERVALPAPLAGDLALGEL